MIKVYSKANCPQCNMVKKFFNDNGVEFESIDVTEEGVADFVKGELGFTGVPAIVADGFAPFKGFAPDTLEAIVEGA